MIGPGVLVKLCPDLSNAMSWSVELGRAAQHFGISDDAEQLMWVANLIYESRGFTRLEEDMNYSAKRMAQVWPHRFARNGDKAFGPNELAVELAYKPQEFANTVYGGRQDLGNGPPHSGDGWHFRGRYPCQLTGRSNYQVCNSEIGIPNLLRPDDLLEDITGMSRVCAWYWRYRGFGALAQSGNFQAIVHKWVGYRGPGQHESLTRRSAIYRDAMLFAELLA